MSYFLVERQEMNQRNSRGDDITYTDLLAAGNGMYGGMGSGQFFSVSPVIQWYSETYKAELRSDHRLEHLPKSRPSLVYPSLTNVCSRSEASRYKMSLSMQHTWL